MIRQPSPVRLTCQKTLALSIEIYSHVSKVCSHSIWFHYYLTFLHYSVLWEKVFILVLMLWCSLISNTNPDFFSSRCNKPSVFFQSFFYSPIRTQSWSSKWDSHPVVNLSRLLSLVALQSTQWPWARRWLRGGRKSSVPTSSTWASQSTWLWRWRWTLPPPSCWRSRWHSRFTAA